MTIGQGWFDVLGYALWKYQEGQQLSECLQRVGIR